MPRALSAHNVIVAVIAGASLLAVGGHALASQPSATTGQASAPSEEAARKQADDKAWADAVRVGTAAAFNGYVQKFPSGAHVAEARSRLAALEAKARADAQATRAALAAIPVIDVKKTCATAAGVAGAKPTQESASGCIQSEEAAREQIAKQWAQFTAADRSRCINPKVYLPSYVEWLTCLEMERDVRNLRREPSPASPGTPKR
jgi:hypothetical protein